MRKPKKLGSGDKIAVFSPSSRFNLENAQFGKEFLERYGLNVITNSSPLLENDYLARSDEDRVNELNEYIRNSNIKALIASRGGYGFAKIIHDVDFETLIENPKIIIAYSDPTIFLNEIVKRGGVAIHGPMLAGEFFRRERSDVEMKSFECTFFGGAIGKVSDYLISLYDYESSEYSKLPKTDSGIIMGGNLAMLASSIGTSYEFNADDCILLIEDIAEPPYKIDRLITQLIHAGKLSKCKGIVLGEFTNCDQKNMPSALDVFKRCLKNVNIPIVANFPSGHGERQMFVPFGTRVEISIEKNNVFVDFKESSCM